MSDAAIFAEFLQWKRSKKEIEESLPTSGSVSETGPNQDFSPVDVGHQTQLTPTSSKNEPSDVDSVHVSPDATTATDVDESLNQFTADQYLSRNKRYGEAKKKFRVSSFSL